MTDSHLAVRYAHAVDQRDGEALGSVFAPDAVFVLDPAMARPGQPAQWQGRDAIVEGVLAGVAGLIATRHEILGQSRPTGNTTLTYCQAHHIFEHRGVPTDEVLAVRYLDTLVGDGDEWLIERREVYLDWSWRQEVRLPRRS
ncbi:nuclear transport factor 2 family protein [Enemella sp. A6]|uniref:nuclear transport factor 2 family protein n=1 Tax=Enemella sp. A6 TaxID=3440152 RepID=UPI003EB7B9DE